jgi:DNA polymerase III alpha subunit (gram-positive type)
MDIMVDIETTGTDPAHSSIIQIAAMAFDIEAKSIPDNAIFDRCLQPVSSRFWDEDTRRWWENQPDVLSQIMRRMDPPELVIKEFADWLENWGYVRLWAKPTSFESPFLESYFRTHGIKNPFQYWKSVDLNSYIEGRGHNRNDFWKNIEFEGDKHNALYDVIHQIKGALSA